MAFTHNQTCTPRDLNGGTIRGWMHTNGLQTNIYDQSHFLSIYFREGRIQLKLTERFCNYPPRPPRTAPVRADNKST